MKPTPYCTLTFISILLTTALLTACAGTAEQTKPTSNLKPNTSSADVSAPESSLPTNVAILQTWSGDYPVNQLERLPAGQIQSSIGFISDEETFAAVWEPFKPGENLPEIDFSKNIVVFSRNTRFYNRTNIFKVTLKNGVAEVLAMETMSAMPIKDRAAMALAVIPRTGVRFIRTGKGQLPVQ